MNLSSNWKGFYSNCDNECYNLTDTHKGGFFACTFSALNSIVQAYNSCKILPQNINLDACLSMSCDSSKNLYDVFLKSKTRLILILILALFLILIKIHIKSLLFLHLDHLRSKTIMPYRLCGISILI